jgi:hypothetical protein
MLFCEPMTQTNSLNRKLALGIQIALGALALVVLGVLASSLYSFPLPDSARYWFGDESWLMLEARTQILEGVLRHPYAYGATINHYIGLLGNTWLASLIYGLPAAILAGRFPIIMIGRTVTFLIALLTIYEVYRLLLRTTKRHWFATFGVLLLVTTSTFAVSSHSARPDLLIGLVVLLAVGYFAGRDAKLYTKPSEWFAFGAIMTLLGLTIAVHLVTLLAPFALFVMLKKGGFRNLKLAGSALLGVIVANGILTLVYYSTTGDLSLFGAHGQHVQFLDVALQKPILRPFSRSVQWNNITQRMVLLWNGAPAVVLMFGAGLLKLCLDVLTRRAKYFNDPEIRFTAISILIVFFSWLLFQTSIEYYMPHFIILGLYGTALLWDCAFFRDPVLAKFRSAIAILLLVAMGGLTLRTYVHLSTEGRNGAVLLRENERAERKLIATMKSDMRATHVTSPLILAESPCSIYLESGDGIRMMGPFFSAFPERDESASETIKRFGVRYALLFDTPLAYGNSDSHDTLLASVQKNGVLIDTATGAFFDIGRSYYDPALAIKDTLKLFRITNR